MSQVKNKTFDLKVTGKDPETQKVTIGGDLGIRNGLELKRSLHAIKFRKKKIVIHLRDVEKLDVTTIQTLRAYKGWVIAGGRQAEIITEFSPENLKLLLNAGFDRAL
jgi:hypothetical protein